jgi:hypothetical protein
MLSLQGNWACGKRIYVPSGEMEWMSCYAQVPKAIVLENKIRIYFATRSPRDKDGHFFSSTTFLDVAKNDPSEILYIHNRPILDAGPAGTFSQHGISPSHVLSVDSEVWLYYGGWSRQIGVPYQIAIGLAISKDGGVTFEKVGEGPILDRSPHEPYGPNSVCVTHESGCWRMFYSSVIEWRKVNGHIDARYILFAADSKDGVEWRRCNRPVHKPSELWDCQCVPTLLSHNGMYYLWYSHRDGKNFRVACGGYSIACLESSDCSKWAISDASLFFHHSNAGFDSMMVCYPSIIQYDGRILMFYCGNNFGELGFGYTELLERMH